MALVPHALCKDAAVCGVTRDSGNGLRILAFGYGKITAALGLDGFAIAGEGGG